MDTSENESAGERPQLTVVGLGASAGGLAALQEFLERLPSGAGMAYVVILHLMAEKKSQMAELLQKSTSIPVTEVTAPVDMREDHVYVIPSDKNLTSVGDSLVLHEREQAGVLRAPIDLFFRTLASTHGPNAVGIVLSGTGSDGAEGLRHIKEAGGVTMAQELSEAEYPDMPRAAIRTGQVDRVLSAASMGPELGRLATPPPPERRPEEPEQPEEVERVEEVEDWPLKPIFALLRRRTGHDFSNYKRSTIRRRMNRRLHFAGVSSLEDYLEVLRDDPEELEALDRDLLITVTNFFRDPEAFAALEEQVIPELVARAGPDGEVRVWVPGCATGEEAYSLAMLFQEEGERQGASPAVQIFATDPHAEALQRAREGLYGEGIVADVAPRRLERHFTREEGGKGYRIGEHLREPVVFAPHDLLHDPPFPRLDLISCRNVLIYMQTEIQRKLLQLFHYSLRDGGYLFLGTSESVEPAGGLFEAVDQEHRIFRAAEVSSGESRPLVPALRSREPIRLPERDMQVERREEPSGPAVGNLHHRLVELYAPPSVLVNPDYEVVHLSETAGRYLSLRGGMPSVRLPEVVDKDLKLEIRSLLHTVFREARSARSAPVAVEADGGSELLRLSARPFIMGEAVRYALVIFEPLAREPVGETPPEDAEGAEDSTCELDAEQLRPELRRAREQLQALEEEYDRALQEYQASNEELQSINEEQRATSEELETSKEELQSVNEELRAMNQEYRAKIDELAEVNADLQNLINSTDIATIFLDRDLAIRRYTPRATDLFNFVEADLGRPVSDVTHRLEYPELTDDTRKVVEQLEKVEREVRTDDDRWFSVRVLPYRTADDRIGGAVLTFLETTDRKTGELERERLLEESREASEAKSRLLSVVSHEFGTPLSGVVGYAELLERDLEGEVGEKALERLRKLRSSADQITAMVEDMLKHAREDPRAERLSVSSVWPGELVREAVGTMEPLAMRKGLHLETEVADDLPEMRTDRFKLLRILVNFLSNGIKYTREGGVTVRVWPTDERVAFEVEDTGQGLRPEERERLFTPQHERPDEETGAPTRGLGLLVVRDLVERLGGEVTVVSEPDQGSRLTVLLPVEPPTEEPSGNGE